MSPDNESYNGYNATIYMSVCLSVRENISSRELKLTYSGRLVLVFIKKRPRNHNSYPDESYKVQYPDILHSVALSVRHVAISQHLKHEGSVQPHQM